MKENIENIQTQEKEPKKVIVEIGPGSRPLVFRLERSDKEASYRSGEEKLFSVKPGDSFIEIDLPPERSIDIFRWRIEDYYKDGKIESLLKPMKKDLNQFLPQGVKGEVLHADGQKLPFADRQIDIIFIANVMGGHVKDDQMLGFKASNKRIFREKQNLIKEAKRVLKVGGKLIIEEEYAPASSVAFAMNKVFSDLKQDSDFDIRDLTDSESGIFVLELTKREPLKN